MSNQVDITEVAERLEIWARVWSDEPSWVTDYITALIADWRKMGDALDQAEAVLSIVEPRSDKAEYLRILGVVRDALGGPK